MLHHAVVTVTYSVHGPDLRTFGRWRCLLCGASSTLLPFQRCLDHVDHHLTLTHRITRGQAVRIRDRGAA